MSLWLVALQTLVETLLPFGLVAIGLAVWAWVERIKPQRAARRRFQEMQATHQAFEVHDAPKLRTRENA